MTWNVFGFFVEQQERDEADAQKYGTPPPDPAEAL